MIDKSNKKTVNLPEFFTSVSLEQGGKFGKDCSPGSQLCFVVLHLWDWLSAV